MWARDYDLLQKERDREKSTATKGCRLYLDRYITITLHNQWDFWMPNLWGPPVLNALGLQGLLRRVTGVSIYWYNGRCFCFELDVFVVTSARLSNLQIDVFCLVYWKQNLRSSNVITFFFFNLNAEENICLFYLYTSNKLHKNHFLICKVCTLITVIPERNESVVFSTCKRGWTFWGYDSMSVHCDVIMS